MFSKNEIESKLFQIFDTINLIENKDGVFVTSSEDIDSIQLISIIVEIEEEFEIEIPDEYLVVDFIENFDHIVDTIEEILKHTTEVDCEED